jgi:hypothetical protein
MNTTDTAAPFMVAHFWQVDPASKTVRQTGIEADEHFLTHRVEYFEDVHNLSTVHVDQISPEEFNRLPLGAVTLVRSHSVPFYGDHFAIITGELHDTTRGMRPYVDVILAPHANRLLDLYDTRKTGVVVLLLRPAVTKQFNTFHNRF